MIALPIFPLRMQSHPYIFCSTSSGIERPEDIKGKEFGMDQYRPHGGALGAGNSSGALRRAAAGLPMVHFEPESADAGFNAPSA